MRIHVATIAAIGLTAVSFHALPQERPAITWVDCPAEANAPGVRCGEIQVPMDYTNPGGEKITVGFFELPATDGGAEHGHIFYNPGGPGGSVYEMANTELTGQLPSALRSEFAWVGVQPRGLKGSTALECGNPMEADPVTMATNFGGAHRANCEANQPGYSRHITTENTARDWEEVRKALALDKIDIYGVSYGTQLASTYATLFPAQVDKMVLDSGYSHTDNPAIQVPASIAVAHEFFAWAAEHNNQLGLGTTAREVYDRWATKVEAESGTNPTLPPPGTPTHDMTKQWENAIKQLASGGQANQQKSPLLQASSGLFTSPKNWGLLAQIIRGDVDATEYLAQMAGGEEDMKQMMTMLAMIYCNENESVARPELLPAAIAGQLTGDPLAMPYLAGSGLVCQGAPPVADYRDISGVRLATRPLQIQGTRDPLTPYAESMPMKEAMGSHLLTVDSANHGHLGVNPAVHEVIVEYLRTGTTNTTWAPQEPIEVLPTHP